MFVQILPLVTAEFLLQNEYKMKTFGQLLKACMNQNRYVFTVKQGTYEGILHEV
jgi:hypothetical protein